jgi:hypothetical protein
MDWVLAFFRMQARNWNERRNSMDPGVDGGEGPEMYTGAGSGVGTGAGTNNSTYGGGEGAGSVGDLRGHHCYAVRQEVMWLKFADLAADKFSKAKAAYYPN